MKEIGLAAGLVDGWRLGGAGVEVGPPFVLGWAEVTEGEVGAQANSQLQTAQAALKQNVNQTQAAVA